MTSSPGLRLLSRSAAAIAFVLAACSTGNGDPSDPPLAFIDEDSPSKPKDEPAPPPDFEPDFGESDAGGDPGGEDEDPPPVECIDDDDPGGSESLAKVLPDTDDCDNSFKTVSGVANGEVDVDFYKLSVADKAGCLLQAEFETKTSGAELCAFVRCKNATADGGFKGCEQGNPAMSGTLHGCCASPGRAVPKWNCSGSNDSADFFFRVRPTSAAVCLPYTFHYRF